VCRDSRAALGPDGKRSHGLLGVIGIGMKTIRVMSRPSEDCINFPTKCPITVSSYHLRKDACAGPARGRPWEGHKNEFFLETFVRRAGAMRREKIPFQLPAHLTGRQSRFAVFQGLGQVLSAVTAKTDWGQANCPQGLGMGIAIGDKSPAESKGYTICAPRWPPSRSSKKGEVRVRTV